MPEKIKQIQILLDKTPLQTAKINDLFHTLYADLTVQFHTNRLLLLDSMFSRYTLKAKILGLDMEAIPLPPFYESSFLDDRFALDPSDYSIALALALKMKKLGRLERAKQLLQRVAESGYPERKFAQQTLRSLLNA